MAAELIPVTGQPLSSSLAERIATFRGKSFALLVYMLKEPDSYWADACKSVGVSDSYSYDLRKQPGYEALLQEIRSHAGDLRSEYAQAAFRQAVPSLADAMIERGKGQGRDAQRAGERILEAVGVLKKENDQQQAPIQVTTHTYVLVSGDGKAGSQGAYAKASAPEGLPARASASAGVIVEGHAKELGPGK